VGDQVGDEQQQLGLQGHRDGRGRVHGLVVGFGAVDGLGDAPGQLVTVVTEQRQTCLGDGVLEVERGIAGDAAGGQRSRW